MSEPAPAPFALFLTVAGRLAVVVGCSAGARRMARSLVSHGADVVVIAPAVDDEIIQMETDGLLTTETRAYRAGDLDGALIAVAASGDAEIDAAIVAEARERGVLVNVPSDLTDSDFIVPSVVRRGALQIAVTTGGGAPSVAREARRAIADTLGPEWERYTELAGEVRRLAMQRGMDAESVARAFAESGVLRRLADGETLEATRILDDVVTWMETAS